MPDEINQSAQPQAPQPQPQPQPQDDAVPKSWEEIFQHPRFKKLNEEARKAQAELERIRAAEAEREKKALEEQNNFKALYEKLQRELDETKRANLRLKIASSKGLPSELHDRLRGETEEELAADADALLTLLGKSASGSVPPPPRGGNHTIDLATETDPKKVREWLKQVKK